MINIVVNLSDGSEVAHTEMNKGSEYSVSEVIQAIKIVHPTWSSMVLTLVRSNVKRGN